MRAALQLRFIGAVGEEAPGSRGARHAVLAYPRPHLLIVGEPSGWAGLTLRTKGHLRLRLRAERAAAHAARVKTGSSDWNVVAPVWAADTVARGPGDAALDHTPGERLALAEFDRSVAVLGGVLRRLVAGGPGLAGGAIRPAL